MTEQLDYKQALVRLVTPLEALAIGGAVVLSLWGWHLVPWLCWAAGAGAVWGYFALMAYPLSFWLVALCGVGMSGTAGYFIGHGMIGTPFLGWVFGVTAALCSLVSKLELREMVRHNLAVPSIGGETE